MSYLFTILVSFVSLASTVSIMAKYVDSERVAGERRMEALFSKKTEALCPGSNQKGMSLCVRQYIKNYKVETAISYSSLTNFIQIAANQDRNAKIYDSSTAQLLAFETMLQLQDQLKKENLICNKLEPSGLQNLLEVKQVCAAEEEQLRTQQEKNKKYIQKKLLEIHAEALAEKDIKIKNWKFSKYKDIQAMTERAFAKVLFEESQYQITTQDILKQHMTTIKTSCENLDSQYKTRFNVQNPCELRFSQMMLACLPQLKSRNPANIKMQEMTDFIQKPLPCYYGKVQEFLSQPN